MSGIVHLNRPSAEIVLELINLQSQLPIALEQIVFGVPVTINPTLMPLFNKNTKVAVTGVLAEGTTGKKAIYYNRLDLEMLFGAGEIGVTTDFSTLEEARALLNQSYGLAISSDELVPAEVDGDGSIWIEIANSLVYQAGSKIKLLANTDLTYFENAVDRYWFYLNFTLPQAVSTV